jgi:hypothetical protein
MVGMAANSWFVPQVTVAVWLLRALSPHTLCV